MTRHPMIARVEEYLALRRSQGYALRFQGRALLGFARFAARVGHRGPLTVDLAVRWARTTPVLGKRDHPWRRLNVLRRFARHLATLDPATQIPPPGLLADRPPVVRRAEPLPRTALAARMEEYVALRRGLGWRLTSDAELLLSFVRFAARVGHDGPLTADLAVRWAQTTSSHERFRAARRLAAVRGFARHLAAFDPATEVPPSGLLGPTKPRRKEPHIYCDAEVADLLQQAAALGPSKGLRPRTYVALFSLLFSTGLRVREAVCLRSRDVDLAAGVLTIRQTKFGKSRLVPLHESAIEPLQRYARLRDRSPHVPRSEFFFRSEHSPSLTVRRVQLTFSRIRDRLGWSAAGRARRPRLHDARHTFATRRLLRWAEEGADVERRLYHLATYLGHVNPSSTYWYLSAVPELMAVTARRYEEFVLAEKERSR